MWRRLAALPIDWLVIAIPLLLTAFGIITIYTITFTNFQSALAIDQLVFAGVGIAAMLLLMFSDYRLLTSLAVPLFLLLLLLLLPLLPWWATKIPFVLQVFGAHRWLDFGVIQFQPAEIFKLVASIFAARLLMTKVDRLNTASVISYAAIAVASFVLVLLQPDLGTASVILVIFLATLLAARLPRRYIWGLVAAVLIAVPLLWSNLQPYQQKRVETFLNPGSDPQGEGYNSIQALIAVGSGGLVGRGFGQGSQTVLNFLPVPHADFIFAGFAEATGFVGSFILVALYLLLVVRIINIAREATDPFAKLLVIAIAAKLAFQSFVHMGMNLGLLPVTGIPLPFMSYGGTALVIDLASIGILQSIHIRHKKSFQRA